MPLKYRYKHWHIYTKSLLFSQCVVYTRWCESETSSQFSTCIWLLVLLLYTCHSREIITMLNWMHEGVYLNTIIVIYKNTILSPKFVIKRVFLCTVHYPNISKYLMSKFSISVYPLKIPSDGSRLAFWSDHIHKLVQNILNIKKTFGWSHVASKLHNYCASKFTYYCFKS